jgi:hypothetical protein
MIVATRKLAITGSPPQTVEVHVNAPEPVGLAWKCTFEIVWPGTTDRSHVMGTDGIQALNLAFQSVAAHLYMSSYHKQQLLVWQEAGAGYGFPLHPKSRDLAIGDDRLM